MENSRKARYDQSPEQMDYHSNEVSIKRNIIIILIQNLQNNCLNKDNNCNSIEIDPNLSLPKEKIQAACTKTKFISEKNKSQYNKENININIIQNQAKTSMKSDENKMDIEPQSSNELIASNSTKYSNNTKLSVESSNQISYSTNTLFYPSSQNNQSCTKNKQNNYLNNNIDIDELISEKKLIFKIIIISKMILKKSYLTIVFHRIQKNYLLQVNISMKYTIIYYLTKKS